MTPLATGSAPLRRTPFYSAHQRNGARLVEFAGWDMPVQFTSVMAEHRAVREKAGVFDISHMGQVWVTGPGARESLDRLVTNDIAGLAAGRGRYALMCNDQGGVIDDLYVYCLSEDRFLVIVNASRAEADVAWIGPRLGPGAELMEQPQAAALAVQGPLAAGWGASLIPCVGRMAKNDVVETPVMDMNVVVARTGYTGEDGFEVFGPAGHVYPIFLNLFGKTAPEGVVNAGLGARDTLRLEMGYPLYGHELDETHTPIQAGLEWAVKLSKPAFVGREALIQEREAGSPRRLIGLALTERGVPRERCVIALDGKEAGSVTSGTFSPSLNTGIAMGYVDPRRLSPGAEVSVHLHGRAVPARLVPLPFYRKQRG